MKNLCKRGLAVLLAFVMCVGMLSLNAFAADDKKVPIDTCNGNHTWQPSGYCLYCGAKNGGETYQKPESGDNCPHTALDADGKCLSCGTQVLTQDDVKLEGSDKDNNEDSKVEDNNEVSGEGEGAQPEKCPECGGENGKHVNKCPQCTHPSTFVPFPGANGTHVEVCSDCGYFHDVACNLLPTDMPGIGRCSVCSGEGLINTPEHTHTWSESGNGSGWEPVGNGYHTRTCTDPNCKETQSEECHTAADDKGSVVCTVCGWVKYNDGISGGGNDTYCPDGEHVFGNTYQHSGAVHWQQCMNCPYTTDHEQCNFELEYKDGTGTVKAHVCSVCGNTIPVNYDDIEVCEKNLSGGHNWVVDRTELATDGKTRLTIVKCTYCGMEKVDGKCNSQEDTYTLTIKYEVPGGQSVFGDHVEKGLLKGATYNVPSPPLHGYAPEVAVVAGTITGDVSVTVKYSPIPYTWTIRYVDEEGNELHSPSVLPYTVDTVKSLSAPANPSIDGYKVKSGSVSAPDPQTLGNVESVVVYESTSTPEPTPSTDPEPTSTPDTDPEPTPTPDTDPEPTPTPEQTQPVDEETETEDNEVDVDDPNVPLDENPVEIDDPEVPLAEKPEEPEKLEEMELENPDTPLADVPQTGDNSHTWGILAALSGIGLMWLALLDKKNKDKAL